MSVRARLVLAFAALFVVLAAVLIGAAGSRWPTGRAGGSFGFVAAALVLLAALVAGWIGFLTGRTSTRPPAAAAGPGYGHKAEANAQSELGELARTVNELSAKLSLQGADIAEYRELLDRAYVRFGEALRATHDLDKMLELVLESSMEAVRARSGAVLLKGDDDLLRVKVGRNLPGDDFELSVGDGIAGYVAASGLPVKVPDGPAVKPDSREPKAASVVAAPLKTQKGVIGVVVLYDTVRGLFQKGDLAALVSRADQAGVAIENALLHQEAQRLAITDGLTGIWNHRFFQLQFEQELERSIRFERPFSLVILDIDDFKHFNDTYGHQVGDHILVELARRVTAEIRDVDSFARYGGEEFVILLPETDVAGAEATAERLRRVISGAPFESGLAPEPIKVTASIGVAGFPDAGQEKSVIFQAADMALLRAKTEGKDRVIGHRPAPDDAASFSKTPADGRRASDPRGAPGPPGGKTASM